MKSESNMRDAVVTDPDKYSVVSENERVRVLRNHDKPGDKKLYSMLTLTMYYTRSLLSNGG